MVIRIDSVLPPYIQLYIHAHHAAGTRSAILLRYACNGELSMNSFICIVQEAITCMDT